MSTSKELVTKLNENDKQKDEEDAGTDEVEKNQPYKPSSRIKKNYPTN